MKRLLCWLGIHGPEESVYVSGYYTGWRRCTWCGRRCGL